MRKRTQRLLVTTFAGLLVPLAAEAFVYPGITLARTGVQLWVFALAALTVALLLRLFSSPKTRHQLASVIYFLVAPLFTLIALLARIAELLVHSNFMYATFHIDPTAMAMASLYVLMAGLPLLDFSFLKRNYKIAALASSLFYIICLLPIGLIQSYFSFSIEKMAGLKMPLLLPFYLPASWHFLRSSMLKSYSYIVSSELH